MASLTDRTYFPPLEECLAGQNIVLSWKLVAAAFSDDSYDRITSFACSAFLKDAYVHQLLKAPSKAFAPSTAQTKADFEAKTAAINVTPNTTPDEQYDIKQIKGDAQWLSKAAKVNEVAALRIVVVEFQSRPNSHLAGPLSTQDLINVQQAAGIDGTQVSAVFSTLDTSLVADAEAIWTQFETESCRRQRILATYLSERRHFMCSVDKLLSFMFDSTLGTMKEDQEIQDADSLRKEIASKAFGVQDVDHPKGGSFDDLLSNYLGVLSECIDRSQTGPESLEGADLTEDLEVDWARTGLTEAAHAMTVMFQILDLAQGKFSAPTVVLNWFKFVEAYAFLEPLQGAHDLIAELVLPLKSLVCVISLKLINPERAIRYLDQDVDLDDHEDPYVASSEILGQIHNTVLGAANANLTSANPIVFAWCLILHQMYVAYQERLERRDTIQNQRAQDGYELNNRQGPAALGRRNSAGSIVSIEKSAYDVFLATANLGGDVQVVKELAMTVTAGGQVHDLIAEMSQCLGSTQAGAFLPVVGARMRLVLLGLLQLSYPLIGYQSEPVTSLLAVLSGGQQYWDLSSKGLRYASEDVTAAALVDQQLLQNYVFQSLSRYPYEFLPFINLCRALSACLCQDERSEIVMKSLLKTPSLTMEQPKSWGGYSLVFEEDNIDAFKTSEDIPLFVSPSAWRRRSPNEEPFTIPAGTFGRFLNQGGTVVLLEYEHSTLALLGKRLEANLSVDPADAILGLLSPDEVAEVIAFLATLLRAESLRATDADTAVETGLTILREASRALPRTKDIISVVCDTLDSFMQADLSDSEDGNIAVLSSCFQFLHAALPICPGRVWSYMPRCDLLNTESKAGRLTRITANLDLYSERFNFLSSAVKFFSSLVDSARDSAVQRKAGAAKHKGSESPWLGTSDKILSRVCLSIAQAAVDTLENTSTWRFQSELHRSTLVRDVVKILNDLVVYTFSIGNPEAKSDDSEAPKKGLTACLKPAAKYVIDSFLSTSGTLRLQPLLATLLVVYQLPISSLYSQRLPIISGRLTTVLSFATTLLKVADHFAQAASAVQSQLFQTAFLAARLYAADDLFRRASFYLLEGLVESAGKQSNEPPSLLGYLGSHTSRSFLQVVAKLDRPFDRPQMVVGAWKFFSSILRNRQPWMANCLLTGKTPREALASDNKALRTPSSDSVLSAAISRLQSIKSISSLEIMALLDFLTSAQNFWPWTVLVTQKQETAKYLDALRSYVRDLKSPSIVAKTDAKEACYQARIAAYIAETFAMQIYHDRKMAQDRSFAKDVVNDLDYYLRNAVEATGYNASLHVNFTRNFSSQYPGCSLDDFRRTVLFPRDLGPQYYYALDFADTMLAFDAGWIGKRQNGFRHEMETANVNLSLVEAQITLYRAWEYLLLELSLCLLPQHQAIARPMLQVAKQCLEANQGQQAPETIFVRLTHSRANLSLTLLQRLAEFSMLPKDTSQLLGTFSATLYSVENPYGADNIAYYRTLLRILFVALRGSNHSTNSTPAASGKATESSATLIQLVLGILDRIVAQGFRTLVTLVHEASSPTTPEDIALVTAILQACLAIPGVEQCETQILNIMAAYDVSHVATSLFSWADKLADKGDPVYGELSILFLLELSALPGVAEQLACDGLLSRITSANITDFMRRGNVSPFADNAGAARCYGIWAKGLLPLLLNLLQALGATVAPEIAYVLSQFPNLLQSSVDRFETPGLSRTLSRETPQFITLIAVSELHSLALLTRVLAALRTNNSRDIPDIEWEAGSLLENVDYWLTSRKVLRERLLPLGTRESDWRATKASEGSGCENKLEEKVVSQLLAVRDVLDNEAE
ncbi:hypothetical protein GQ53DRAFT_77865 [Thozetella sp. PMI_491]|nr:hypothetical protein GQ53DRAFT_77865 [Thozetella sp. PMI_491]